MVDISQPGLERTRELIAAIEGAPEVILHVADVTDDSAVKGMVDACIDKFGRIDFACNNAGMAMPSIMTTEIPMETFDRLFDVNLKSVSDPGEEASLRPLVIVY